MYTSEILDDRTAPRFRVTASDDASFVLERESASAAWMGVLSAVHKARQDCGLVSPGAKCAAAISGPEYFGFATATIAELIEALPSANLCVEYHPRSMRSAKPSRASLSQLNDPYNTLARAGASPIGGGAGLGNTNLLDRALIDLQMLEKQRIEKEREKLMAAKRRAEEQEIRRRMREAERAERGLQRQEALEMRRREKEMQREARGHSKLKERQSKELGKALEHRERSQRRLVEQLQRRRKKNADVVVRRKIRLDDSHTLQMRRLSQACWDEPLQLPWFFSQQLASTDKKMPTVSSRLVAEAAEIEIQCISAAAKAKAAKGKGKAKATAIAAAAAAIEGGTSGSIGEGDADDAEGGTTSTVLMTVPKGAGGGAHTKQDDLPQPLPLQHPLESVGDVVQLWNFLQIFLAPSKTPVPPLHVFSSQLRMPHASEALDHIHLRLLEVLMQELPNDLDLEKNERDRERREDNSAERKTEFFRVGVWKPFGPKRPLCRDVWQEFTRQYMLARVLEFGGTSPQRIMTSMSVVNPVSEDQGKAIVAPPTKVGEGVNGEENNDSEMVTPEVGPGKGRWRSWGTLSVMLFAKGGHGSGSIVKAVGDLEGAMEKVEAKVETKVEAGEGAGREGGGAAEGAAIPGHSTIACHVEFEKIGNKKEEEGEEEEEAEAEAGTAEGGDGAAEATAVVAMEVEEEDDEDAFGNKREPLVLREEKMRRALRRLADREEAAIGAAPPPLTPSLVRTPTQLAAAAPAVPAAGAEDDKGPLGLGFVPTDTSWVGWLQSLAAVPSALGKVVERRLRRALEAGGVPTEVATELEVAMGWALEEQAETEGAYAHAQNIGLQAVYAYMEEGSGGDKPDGQMVLRARLVGRLVPKAEAKYDEKEKETDYKDCKDESSDGSVYDVYHDTPDDHEPTIRVEELQARVQGCMDTLRADPMAEPFMLPINVAALGKVGKMYKKLIKRPMDLTTIQTNIDEYAYLKMHEEKVVVEEKKPTSPRAGSGSSSSSSSSSSSPPVKPKGVLAFKAAFSFAADCRLVFSNCKLFNDENTPLWLAAHEMAGVFERAFGELMLVAGGAPYMLMVSAVHGPGGSEKFQWVEEPEKAVVVGVPPALGQELGAGGQRRQWLTSLAKGRVSLSMWFGGEHRPARVANQQLQRQLVRLSQLLGELDYWELELQEKIDVLKTLCEFAADTNYCRSLIERRTLMQQEIKKDMRNKTNEKVGGGRVRKGRGRGTGNKPPGAIGVPVPKPKPKPKPKAKKEPKPKAKRAAGAKGMGAAAKRAKKNSLMNPFMPASNGLEGVQGPIGGHLVGLLAAAPRPAPLPASVKEHVRELQFGMRESSARSSTTRAEAREEAREEALNSAPNPPMPTPSLVVPELPPPQPLTRSTSSSSNTGSVYSDTIDPTPRTLNTGLTPTPRREYDEAELAEMEIHAESKIAKALAAGAAAGAAAEVYASRPMGRGAGRGGGPGPQTGLDRRGGGPSGQDQVAWEDLPDETAGGNSSASGGFGYTNASTSTAYGNNDLNYSGGFLGSDAGRGRGGLEGVGEPIGGHLVPVEGEEFDGGVGVAGHKNGVEAGPPAEPIGGELVPAAPTPHNPYMAPEQRARARLPPPPHIHRTRATWLIEATRHMERAVNIPPSKVYIAPCGRRCRSLAEVWYFLEGKKRKARDRVRRRAAKESIAAEKGIVLEDSDVDEEEEEADAAADTPEGAKVSVTTSKMSAEAIETAAETVMHEQQLHQSLEPSSPIATGYLIEPEGCHELMSLYLRQCAGLKYGNTAINSDDDDDDDEPTQAATRMQEVEWDPATTSPVFFCPFRKLDLCAYCGLEQTALEGGAMYVEEDTDDSEAEEDIEEHDDDSKGDVKEEEEEAESEEEKEEAMEDVMVEDVEDDADDEMDEVSEEEGVAESFQEGEDRFAFEQRQLVRRQRRELRKEERKWQRLQAKMAREQVRQDEKDARQREREERKKKRLDEKQRKKRLIQLAKREKEAVRQAARRKRETVERANKGMRPRAMLCVHAQCAKALTRRRIERRKHLRLMRADASRVRLIMHFEARLLRTSFRQHSLGYDRDGKRYWLLPGDG
jgi:hypothetical protein